MFLKKNIIFNLIGDGDWGLGIGGLAQNPKPKTPNPQPQTPNPN